MKKSFSERNILNNLNGSQWLAFTRSWFIHNPPPRSKKQIKHPAKFPEQMIKEFIEFFTKKGETVLDPFLGVGSTMMAASSSGRNGIGIEINKKYYDLSKEQLKNASNILLFNNDSNDISRIWIDNNLTPVDFVITSPPYWDMLAHSRGGVFSNQKRRKSEGLDTVYSTDDPRDLGNIKDYEEFINLLLSIFKKVRDNLKKGKYIVIIVQNLRSKEGRMIPLAWDLACKLEKIFVFKGEKIWCQDNKKLGIWGYPVEFVSNIHHHYCLIFKNIL